MVTTQLICGAAPSALCFIFDLISKAGIAQSGTSLIFCQGQNRFARINGDIIVQGTGMKRISCLGFNAISIALGFLLVPTLFLKPGFGQQAPAHPQAPGQVPTASHLLGEASLKGLKRIEVTLSWGTLVPNPETEPWPTLTKMRPKILANMADRLRSAGFEVRTMDKSDPSKIQDPEVALLGISLQAYPALPYSLRENPGLLQASGLSSQALNDRYICSFQAELRQAASLLRDGNVAVNATTLTLPSSPLLLQLAELEEFFIAGIGNFLDRFIETHRSVNGNAEYRSYP